MKGVIQKEGTVFVLAGPSGSGKTTLAHLVLERIGKIQFSISWTTRKPRSGEHDEVDYHFVDRQSFEKNLANGLFLENAEVHGNWYGTPRPVVEKMLADGIDVLLDIDVQGARQIRASMPGAVTVFVAPPGIIELERRLRARETESDGSFGRRMRNALDEIKQAGEFDYIVINDKIESCFSELEAIIRVERLRSSRMETVVESLFC